MVVSEFFSTFAVELINIQDMNINRQDYYEALVDNMLQKRLYFVNGVMTEPTYYTDTLIESIFDIRMLMKDEGLTFPLDKEEECIKLLSTSYASKLSKAYDTIDKDFSMKIRMMHNLISAEDILKYYSVNH